MLLWIKANRERLENWLATTTAGLFVAAVCVNLGCFFSVRQTPSVLGRLCSWTYLIAWILSAVFLHGQPQWLRIILRTRWAAAAAILLALAASSGGGPGLLSAVCVMPYAVFVSPYRGLDLGAWAYFVLPALQAGAATLLFLRLRKKKARKKQKNGQY